MTSLALPAYAPFQLCPTPNQFRKRPPSALHRVGRGKARGRVQPGSIVQETAAEIDQGIAAAARDDVDHPADGDSGGEMIDGLLQHAIDRTNGVIEDRLSRKMAEHQGIHGSNRCKAEGAGNHAGGRSAGIAHAHRSGRSENATRT
jgi:hypothetical protein